MSITATSPHTRLRRQPRLRLVHDANARHTQPRRRHEDLASERAALDGHLPYVLVAGASLSTRSKMLGELRNLLPPSTRFLEACEAWEVLARAGDSRMVVLTEDLGDLSAESLVRLLGRRHPDLPVLAVGARTRTGAPMDLDVATV